MFLRTSKINVLRTTFVAGACAVAISLAAATPVAASSARVHPHAGNADFVGVWDATTGGWTILTQDSGGACTGTSDYTGYIMSACQVTGDNYVFTLTYGDYTSNNSGTITGNSISGMFSDSNGTMEDYTASRLGISAKSEPADTYLEGSEVASFTVSLSQASSSEVDVHYATKDGVGPDAAKAADGDYEPTKGTIVFTPGETVKQIDVKCFADIQLRSDADFDLVLSELLGPNSNAAQIAHVASTRSPRGDGPPSITVRESIDPNLRVGQVGAIKNLTTGQVGTLWVKRYDTHRIFKLKEGDWVYVGDELFLDSNTASAIEFVLGGAAAVQPGSHVQVIDQRHTYVLPGSRFTYLRQLIRIIDNVSHQKETIQIQTNGGVIGIKG